VETIKAERDSIESELKSATVDMKSKFLNALAQDGAISEHAMSVESLEMIYGPLQRQVKESLQKQEALVADIQVSYRSTAITLLHFTNYSFSMLSLGIFRVLTALLLKDFCLLGCHALCSEDHSAFTCGCLKCQQLFAQPHSVTSQKSQIFMSNLDLMINDNLFFVYIFIRTVFLMNHVASDLLLSVEW
jgi:hypothetical protein